MEKLSIKEKGSVKWDEVSLGEVMLRFDPGETRVKVARKFNVSEGGGEYNVARGLKRCFGLNTAIVTGNVENEVGYLLEDLLYQGGVDQSHVKWFPYDGIGKKVRVGFNFTERGYGVRGAVGTSDRGHTAASNLKVGDIDWNKIFKEEGARWFHTGGIFAALSETTPDVVIEALKIAKENGVMTSYDLNYRPSLWKDIGGIKKAQEVNREIAKYVDVMIGNEEDFHASLGFEIKGVEGDFGNIKIESYKNMIKEVCKAYPNFKAVATTLRNAKTATINDWGAILYYEGEFFEAVNRENLEIMDRVGGGDSFASGLIYGFLSGKTPSEAVNFGAAHGALAMTTPGDTTMASLKEVERLVAGGNARVQR
ncbi:MAG: 2-dehydro-3-deoxygluconokinase [Alphaproteobacteria bacterium ADurb.Bin438]|nr:MAG: 2-dehydro-3-deoxygluconokinase [Alphaproteobacteria bacterium ADurb.Bin438]